VRVYETVLYTPDVAAASRFYADAVGLRLIEADDLMAAFRLDDGGVLPSHGAWRDGHVAFAVGAGELDAARARLRQIGVEIESERTWEPVGGRSTCAMPPGTRWS
jgi:catechol 2,3-dioxygenase-like lactoylglutathione lyase family enzyme